MDLKDDQLQYEHEGRHCVCKDVMCYRSPLMSKTHCSEEKKTIAERIKSTAMYIVQCAMRYNVVKMLEETSQQHCVCCIIAYHVPKTIEGMDAQVTMQGNAIQCMTIEWMSQQQCKACWTSLSPPRLPLPLSLFHQSCAFFFRPPSDCEVCKGHSFSTLGDSQYTNV